MKKLSTSLKKFGKLNESNVDSKESYMKFGRNALKIKLGSDYTDQDAEIILTNIYDSCYPDFNTMLKNLTLQIMSGAQKSKKAEKIISEIFYMMVDNPNVSDFYKKLAEALSLDGQVTLEVYSHFVAGISESINTSGIDLTKYYYPNFDDVSNIINGIYTPEYALAVVESALLLYSYILANTNSNVDFSNHENFYNDIMVVYNDYRDSYSAYKMDMNQAENFFKTSLSFRDPSFYCSGNSVALNVPESALPIFLASYMNFYMMAYNNNKDQILRRITRDDGIAFVRLFEAFKTQFRVNNHELFLIDEFDISSKRLKELFQLGLEISSKIKNMSLRKSFIAYLNLAKNIIDELSIIEDRTQLIRNV